MMKGCGAEYQNCGVDEESEAERGRRIDHCELDGLALVLRLTLECAGLHDARVQVEIVRHHRGAQDADGQVEHLAVEENLTAGKQSLARSEPERPREKDFIGETAGDGGDQRYNQGLDPAEAAALERKNK